MRVLIVAAYASVRAGLHALLADAGGYEVVGEVSGSAELERLLPAARPDVVLYDDHPSDRPRVLDVLADGEAGLVMLGADRADFQRLAAAPLPAWAYLLKEADGGEIAAAVRAVAAGLVVLDRSLSPLLIESRRPAPDDAVPLAAGAPPAEAGLRAEDMLTARESEVLQLMAQGLPNKQIAARLRVSPHTVKFHVASILAKLGAASRTEAVALGARRGLFLL